VEEVVVVSGRPGLVVPAAAGLRRRPAGQHRWANAQANNNAIEREKLTPSLANLSLLKGLIGKSQRTANKLLKILKWSNNSELIDSWNVGLLMPRRGDHEARRLAHRTPGPLATGSLLLLIGLAHHILQKCLRWNKSWFQEENGLSSVVNIAKNNN
jgi:hypothetical protein